MAKIKGKWVFNDIVKNTPNVGEREMIDIFFTSNGQTFMGLYWYDIPAGDDIVYHIAYDHTAYGEVLVVMGLWGDMDAWQDGDVYKTIEFNGEQEVSEDFIAWMMENATLQEEEKPTIWFTKLNLSDIVRTIGNRNFRKLSTIALPQLTAPAIELDGTTLNIYDEEGLATSYDILVNGEVVATVEKKNLITFTIEGVSYRAEDGMTWVEWVNSTYNSGGVYISDNYVYQSDYSKIVYKPVDVNGNVYSTDIIISDGEYGRYISQSGGAND